MGEEHAALLEALAEALTCLPAQPGLVDMQIVRAIYRACESGRSVPVETARKAKRPSADQKIHRPPVEETELVHVRRLSGEKK